jgi:hypothetical protein
LNVHNVSDVRKVEVHVAELVTDPSPFEVEMKFWQNWFKREEKHYSLRSIHKFILFGIRKNCLISGRSLLLYQFTKRWIKLTIVIIMGCHCYQLHTKFYRISYSQG